MPLLRKCNNLDQLGRILSMTTRRHRPLAIALFLALGALACDSSSDPDPTATATPAETATADASSAGSDEGGGGIVLHNAAVVTMDEAQPEAQAVLIRGDRIVAVGSDEDVMAEAGSAATLIDLEGRALVPGFIDSHSHRLANYEERGFSSAAEVIPVALSEGWTTVAELNVREDNLPELEALDASGGLRLRVEAYLATNTPDVQPLPRWWEAYQPGQVISPYLRIAGLKFFVDFDWGREIRISEDALTAALVEAQDGGWQLAVKSISSESLAIILDGLDRAQDGQGPPTYRNRIEHALAITEEQGQRMAELGIVASIQTLMPPELTDDPEFFAFADRQPDGATTPWRRIVDQGVVIANGSAWPSTYFEEPEGAPFGSPMRLLYQAATRISNRGALPEPWEPEQAITVEEALRALTIDAAYATFRDEDIGSITPGKLADLVVLSANPLEVDFEEIPFIETLVTFVGGRAEWCAEDAGDLCPRTSESEPQPGAQVPTQGLVVAAGAPIRIALLAPTSGQHAELGPAELQAALIAAGDYGPIAGRQVEIVPFDDGCSQEPGAEAARQVVADGGFVAVIGPGCSASAQGGLPILQEAGVPVVSPSATLPGLSSLAPEVFNRVVLDDDQLAAEGVDPSYVDDQPAAQELYGRYEAQYGSLPPEAYRAFLLYAFDAYVVLVTAIDDVAAPGDNGALVIDLAALAEAIRATGDHVGVTGTITFDSEGNRLP
jgi:predicted amidohydrolase YtcJ/ABC-type branched-subunit amino acid transport system substrate-binding protein